MIQERDGVWRVTVDLPVGTEYEFRYIVDGEWTTDYHADELSTNAYGSQNSPVKADYPISVESQRQPCDTTLVAARGLCGLCCEPLR